MKHTLRITTDHETLELSCQSGQTIAEALLNTPFAIAQPCGGRGVCGKCRVRAQGSLAAPDEPERKLLGEEALNSGERLACRARIAGDCDVLLQHQAQAQIVSGEAYANTNAEPYFRNWGAAVDIGTTTLALQLYNRKGLAEQAVSRNPQDAFGADVMSRIGAALSGEGLALRRTIVGKIEELLGSMALECGIAQSEIDAMVLTGNTTMLYLLTGRNPEALSRAPFAADCLFDEEIEATEIGFVHPAACYLPRCASAFVGADITTALLASGMLERDQTALLVDIGTNGEMALWHDNRLLCCATAAGPAFEGAEISCGCQGVRGAIDQVWPEDSALEVHTIGGAEPVGICGSGIIDAVSAMLETGRLDETGRVVQPDAVNGEDAVMLAGNISLSQKDVRNVQLAKSAICAGIRTLLKRAQLETTQVDAFYIAGGFGSYIDLNSAARIGLFPPELLSAAHVIGNAAQTGAAMMLLDGSLQRRMAGPIEQAEVIDLSTDAYFMQQYIDGMLL